MSKVAERQRSVESPGKRNVSKRLRFEILKRDGFACRYCGALATATELHVDHVKPLAEGGTNDPHNLVTSCASCNGGKGPVPLDESRLGAQRSAEELREQAQQIRDYTDAALELEDAMRDLLHTVCNRWMQDVGAMMSDQLYSGMRTVLREVPLATVFDAVAAVAARRRRSVGWDSDSQHAKYFYGCIRNMKAGT